MTAELTPQEILSLPIDAGTSADAKTVGQYLMRHAKLAYFTGATTCPYGNPDAETALVLAFAEADLMWLHTDENGCVDDYSSAAFYEILTNLYDFLFDAEFSTIVRPLPPPPPRDWYLVCVGESKEGPNELSDYFRTGFTEEDAKLQAEIHNESYDYHAWHAVHLPS